MSSKEETQKIEEPERFQSQSEFVNYVVNNYALTNLTDRDAYEVGALYKRHTKELRGALRWVDVWNLLHIKEDFGWSEEAFRRRVTRYIDNDYQLFTDNSIVDGLRDGIELQKLNDNLTGIRGERRQIARIEEWQDALKEAINSSFERITIKKRVEYSSSKAEAILLLGDLHLGEQCSNAYNTYNVEIARERLERLANRTIYYCQTNKINTLHICNLGDMIDGYIHVVARIQSQLDIIQQVLKAAEFITQFLTTIDESVPHLIYHSVDIDNHGRTTANYKESVDVENYATLIDTIVAERLKKTDIKLVIKDPFGPSITPDFPENGVGKIVLNNKQIFLFAHGHQDNPKSDRTILSFSEMEREKVSYIALGHYHSASAKDSGHCKLFVNGSIVGVDDYADSKNFIDRPSQKLLIFDTGKDGVVDVQDIDIVLGKYKWEER